ncbi:hypothetical protein, partial [Thermus sp.]|uniref:hypothetical protein n=1 Tax=Thermus sp. TaxID=275 RepID=UPI00298EECF1
MGPFGTSQDGAKAVRRARTTPRPAKTNMRLILAFTSCRGTAISLPSQEGLDLPLELPLRRHPSAVIFFGTPLPPSGRTGRPKVR